MKKKQGKKIFLFLVSMTLFILCFSAFVEYKNGYTLCMRYKYIYPVDCQSETLTFSQYWNNYNIIQALKDKNLTLEDIYFSSIFQSWLWFCVLFSIIYFIKNRFQANKQNNIKEEDQNQIRFKANLALFLGILPYLYIVLNGINHAQRGIGFINHVYGLEAFVSSLIWQFFMYLPFNIIGLILLIISLKNFKKLKK